MSADDGLRNSVLQALVADERTAALDLRVGVLNAVVHLGAGAPLSELRSRAEAVCDGVAGVRGVVNRIQAPGAPSPARTIHVQLPKDTEGEP